MTDAELLDKLLGPRLGLFESRREAEHVVGCRECDVTGGDPYRCRLNPARRREILTGWVMRRRMQVVWTLQGFPGRSKMDDLLHQVTQQYLRGFVADMEHASRLLEPVTHRPANSA